MAEGPLAGIRVVDVTTARSGPTCTRQLADYGAEVVWVGNPAKGDVGGSDGDNLRRGVRSVLVDLKHPDGVAVLRRLVARADVFVENWRPGVKHRLGLAPERCWEDNPGLVYASLSGFGQTGPWAERPSVDQITQGMSGLMSVTGPPGSGPWRAGIAVSDTVAGTFLAQGVLAALIGRQRTGRGQWVHTSLLETMVNLMDFQAVRYLNDGEVPGQAGNDHPTFFPMGTYETADGWVNIAGMLNLSRFLDALGAPELGSDPRFATDADRRANRDRFRDECVRRLRRHTTAHWVEQMAEAGIPAGPVYTVDEVFADAQVAHLGMAVEVPGRDRGPVTVLRHPITLTQTPTAVPGGPPVPGADTVAVLRELGYDSDGVAALLGSGAVADRRHGRDWSAG